MRIVKWLKEEIILVIPAVIYFIIAFNLIHFSVGLALEPDDVRDYNYYTVTLGALVAGKILIIVNQFNLLNAFPNKPLIYNIVWQTWVYALVTFLFRVIEAWVHYYFQYDNVRVAVDLVQQHIASPLFWSTQIWLFLVFMIFVVFSEFTRVLGKDKILYMLFGNNKYQKEFDK